MKTNEDKKGKGGRNVQKTLLFSLLIFCGLAIIGIGSAAAAPSVSVDPASTTDLSPGGTFSINVSVDSESYNLRACNIDLTYNSTALSVVSVTYENLLGTSANVLDMSDPTDDGCITSSIARKTLTNPSAPASGTYITVNFEVKSGAADDTYDLTLSSVTLKDENNDAIPGVQVTDGTVTVGAVGPTLTWQVEPPTSVEQGDGVTFDVSFSESAAYYFRIENSSGGIVWRYPTIGTNSAMDPQAKTWPTTTDTPTGDYTIIININDVDNADTRTVTVQALVEQVQVSDAEGGYEPDIALSSTGETIYVAFADDYVGIDFAKSTNDGASFNLKDQVSTGGEDAAVAAYGENNVYVVWYEDYNVYYARSTNGGDSFETAVPVSDAGGMLNPCENPDIAVDSNGVIYVVWDYDTGTDYTISIDKSTNGTTFDTDVRVDDDTVTVVKNPSIAIDSSNNILVAWQGGDHVYFANSTNDGATFSTPVPVDDSTIGAYDPSIVVDPMDSSKIHVAWKDLRDDGGDIYVATSSDGGANFDTGVKVNDDGTDTAQQFPCMAVNSTGAVFVVWQDGRNYASGSDYDVYLAGSDGANRKVNPDGTKAKTPTLAVDDTNAFVAWKNTDTDDGKIYFAKKLLVPEVPTPALTTITVTPATANVAVEGIRVFTATAKDQNSEVMADVVITWTSSDTSVGTVSPASATTGTDGTATTTFTALVNGTTTVMAESAGVSGTAEVTVTPVTLMEGDVSMDMHVTMVDAMFIAQFKAGTKSLNASQLKCADTTDEGAVTMTDAMHIAQWRAGIPFKPLWESPADDDMLPPVS